MYGGFALLDHSLLCVIHISQPAVGTDLCIQEILVMK